MNNPLDRRMKTDLAKSLALLALVATFAPAASAAPGDLDTSFNPSANGSIYGVAVQPDGKTVIGGYFNTVGGQTRNRVARLNADGTLEAAFNPDANNGVNGVLVQADRKIVIGGAFTTVSGQTRNRVARLNADGTLDPAFNSNANADIHSLALQADGKILIGGQFTTIGGQARNCIARLNADGTLDTPFDPNANFNIDGMAVQADGKIVIGGSFTTVGGQPRNRIARLNADGTLDTPFNPNANLAVHCLVVQSDGKIVIGGSFTTLGTATRNRIARLNADGTLDTGFNPDSNGAVDGMALQTDGKIVIGGSFTSVGGQMRNRVARLNTNGAVDLGFNPNASDLVLSPALQADGKVVLGGGFTTVGGVARNRIARLENDAATQSLTVPNTSTVQWLRGGASPETHQVTFELSTDNGITWTLLGVGARISGGWSLTGLSLPNGGQVRARARATSGNFNGSSGLIESVAAFSTCIPQILVRGKSVTILDGDTTPTGNDDTNFFDIPVCGGSKTHTFTIYNFGKCPLTVTNITSSNPSEFAVGTLTFPIVIAAGGAWHDFTVTFDPSSLGTRTATLSIASDDSTANPYNFALSGNGICGFIPGTLPTSPAVISGPIYNPANGHVYYLLNENTWTASETEAVSLGGHLATVRSQAENDWIYAQFAQFGGVPRGLWIGLNDAAQEGPPFVWVSGEPVSYLNWASGEPMNQNGLDDYVHLFWPGDTAGRQSQWNDQWDLIGTQFGGIPINGVVEVSNFPPVLTCATNKTVLCGAAWTFDPPTALDSCGGTNVTVTVLNTLTNGLGCSQVITRTWLATDACGNTNTCSQAVTVVDTTPPILTCATNKAVACGTNWSFDLPTASDACSGTNVTVVIASTVTNSTAVACQTAITRTWQATDACGNSTTCSQTVTVVDSTPPVFNCPTNKIVQCGTAWTFDTPMATDNCSPASAAGPALLPITILNTVTNGNCPMVITRTWLASDSCGNTNSCSQSVTVLDTAPTTLSVSGSANIFGAGLTSPPNPGGGGTGILPPVHTFPAGPGKVLTFLSVTGTASLTVGSASAGGDGYFNIAPTDINSFGGISGILHNGASFLVGVFLDSNTPSGTAPPRLDFRAPPPPPPGGLGTSFTQLSPLIGQTFFIGDGLTGSGSGAVQQFNVPPNATRLFLGFADAAGYQGNPGKYDDNGGSLTAAFAIRETLICATNKTVVCGTAWTFDPPTVVSGCGGTNSLAPTVLNTVTNGICPLVLTRTWQSIDACGLTNTCSQTVTVIDTTPPVLTCATHKTVLCGTAWTFDAPTAIDACSGTNVTLVIASTVTNATAVVCQTAITRTWQATDACGNSATCSQTVTVVDTAPPILTCATNKTVLCGALWSFDPPTATDTCSGTNVTITVLNTATNGVLCPQVITRTWLATDACGNTGTCSQTVTLVDNSSPVTCVETDCITFPSSTATHAFTGYLACQFPGPGVALSLDSPGPSNAANDHYLRARDLSGASTIQNLSAFNGSYLCLASNLCAQFCFDFRLFIDGDNNHLNFTPSFVLLSDSDGPCGTNPPIRAQWVASFAVTEDGGTNAGWHRVCAPIQLLGSNGSLPNSAQGSWQMLDGRPNTDWNILLASVTGLVLPIDFTSNPAEEVGYDNFCFSTTNCAPVIACATNKTVNCGSAWTFDPPSVLGGCSGANVTITVLSTMTNGICPMLITQTWQATDACGNSATCSQTVTVVDTTPPVITCSTNKTVKCDQAWTFDTPTASDACSGKNVTVTVLNVVTNGVCPQLITATWLATDACGNTNTCSQTVTVLDTVPPLIQCPANITRYTCSNSVPVFYQAWATDACSPIVSVSYSPPSGTKFPAGTTTPVTVTAKDGCGNTSTCTFTVTVVDQTIQQTLIRGMPDCYSSWFNDGPAARSACLTTAYGSSLWKSFDISTVNRRFGLSWQGLPGNVSSAQVFTQMKPRKTLISSFPVLFSSPENDTISFGLNACNSSGWLWSQLIGSLPGGGPVWQSQAGCGVSFSFNLQTMPGLLPHMNTSHRLDMLVQNDTTVDYAMLRIRYCPPQIFNGHPVYLNNAVAVVAPTNMVLAQDPGMTAATNVSAVFALGDTRDARILLDVTKLAESASSSLAVIFSSRGEDAAAERHGFRLENNPSSAGSGTTWQSVVSANVINPRIRLLREGQEVGRADGLRPLQVRIGAAEVEFVFTGGTNATARFGIPVLFIPGSGQPSVLADAIELTFERSVPMDAVATEIELSSANVPEFGVRNITSGLGGNYDSVRGNVLVQHSGGQLVLSPLDESSDQPFGATVRVASANEFRAFLGASFGILATPSTNSSLSLITRAMVASQERDLPSLHFGYTGSAWQLAAKREGVSLPLSRVQVWTNGVLLVTATNAPSVQLSSLPSVHWPTLVGAVDDGITHRFPYAAGVDVVVNGVRYSGTEFRIQTDTFGQTVQTLIGERVEAVRAEVLVLPPLEAGPPQYRLDVPELGPNDVTIRWSGIAGVLESAPSLVGPWESVRGSESGEIMLPIESAQAQFFRVRSR